MSTGLVEPPMTDEKPRTLSVKLPMDVIESARVVSACRGESMTELLGDILRPIIAKMEQEELGKRIKPGRSKGSKP
jgi:hypothetical protein